MAETTTPGGLPRVDAASRDRLLKDVLKGVSRSFYLTLRVLPKNLRDPIGVAYLLARTADTLTDRRRAGFTGARLEESLAVYELVRDAVNNTERQHFASPGAAAPAK